jgi:hypothetical protein
MYPHRYAGIPGLVTRAKNRRTRTLVSLYHATQAGRPTVDGEWLLVCEAHGVEHHYERRAVAEQHMRAGDWCAACLLARPLPVAMAADVEGPGDSNA